MNKPKLTYLKFVYSAVEKIVNIYYIEEKLFWMLDVQDSVMTKVYILFSAIS